MRRRIVVALIAALFPVLLASSGAGAAKRHANWVHPQYASFHVQRIALVPVVTYDHDADAEASIGTALLRALSTKGYAWMAPESVVAVLAVEPADGTLHPDAVRRYVLRSKEARVDSLAAPTLCGRLQCDAVLSARVEDAQSGRPWMKGALVGRDGTLLWTGDRTADSFVGRTRDKTARRAAEHAAAQSWVGGLLPILDRWVSDFPTAAP